MQNLQRLREKEEGTWVVRGRRQRCAPIGPPPAQPTRASSPYSSSCPPVPDRRRMVLLQLHPTGGAGASVSVGSQPGWGNKQDGDELQPGALGSSLSVPGMGAGLRQRKFQAGTYRARQHGRGRRVRRARGKGRDRGQLLRPKGARATARPRLEQIADPRRRAPRPRTGRRPRIAQSGQNPVEVPGRQQVGGGFTWTTTYFVEPERPAILRPSSRSSTGTPTPSTWKEQKPTASHHSRTSSPPPPHVAGAGRGRHRRRRAKGRGRDTTARQQDALQIDATLCYAKGGLPAGYSNADNADRLAPTTHTASQVAAHADHDPPRPSLRAALAPPNVPYLFYVTGPTGWGRRHTSPPRWRSTKRT